MSINSWGGGRAQLVFTDPPYNVNYKPPKAGSGHYLHRYGHRRGYGDGKIFNDNLSDENILILYRAVLSNLYKFSKDNASIYWWYGSKNQHINRQAFIDNKWHVAQILIWLKNGTVFSLGQDYHRCYEPCMFGWKKGKPHYSNKKFRTLRDVFNLDKLEFEEMFDVWYERRDATINYEHPTQKPVRLAERALKKNTTAGDIVVDLFGGSGSTLIACEQAERRCMIMELDPKYCDVISNRWEKFTSKKAVRV